MDNFIQVTDRLSEIINEKSTDLYHSLIQVDIDNLGMPEGCLIYFKGSHFKRLFFSIETSARLLYYSIRLSGKPVEEIILMDYGAGVGTLYTLAKMIGCKKVIYNDFLPDWQLSAQLIGKKLNVVADEYIVGDIDETLAVLDQKKIHCDIITSRNVIEHIYKLSAFYSTIALHQPNAIVFSSTTANSKNPLTNIQHFRLHKKWERHYLETRIKIIKEFQPSLSEDSIKKLAVATRGLNKKDIHEAITNYLSNQKIPDPSIHRTNTCEPTTGLWVEHLLYYSEYRMMINENNYQVDIRPGFWDTHYRHPIKNLLGWVLNPIINSQKRIGYILSPFIYVVAVPMIQKNKT